MANKIITNFFREYINNLPSNPLNTEHFASFLKFRSDISIREISNRVGENQHITELVFHFLDPHKLSFESISHFFYRLFSGSIYLTDDLSNTNFIIDLNWKKVKDDSCAILTARVFILKKIDLSFVSFFNKNLTDANEILETDSVMWDEFNSSYLSRFMSQRNTEVLDLYKFREYFESYKMDSNDLNNLNLLNLFVPRFFSSITDFDIYGQNGLFKDILPQPKKDFQNLLNELDRDGGDEYEDEPPF